MVEYRDTDYFASGLHLVRYKPVCFAGIQLTARMVVGDDHGNGSAHKRSLKNFPRMHGTIVGSSQSNQRIAGDSVGTVEIQCKEMLTAVVESKWPKKRGNILISSDFEFLAVDLPVLHPNLSNEVVLELGFPRTLRLLLG